MDVLNVIYKSILNMIVSTDNASSAGNQQEILHSQEFYFTGFCCGESSFSIIKDKTNTGSGYKYYPDITFSNADLSLLKKVNLVVGENQGLISAIKGGYNLSYRGKRKVKIILSFFKKYPPVVGDIVKTRLFLIQTAICLLESRKGRTRTPHQTQEIEKIRFWFRQIRQKGQPILTYPDSQLHEDAIGHFLAGILDAEGSVGMKKSGSKNGQPFVALAMKDKKIVELFQQFCRTGKVRYRPMDRIYHFEIGAKNKVSEILTIFDTTYPFKLSKMRRRMQKVQEILNDYTPGSG